MLSKYMVEIKVKTSCGAGNPSFRTFSPRKFVLADVSCRIDVPGASAPPCITPWDSCGVSIIPVAPRCVPRP